MPRISKSASSIPASAIRMLTPFADKAKADGDEGFSERLRGVLTQMGYAKVSEIPAEKYEDFVTSLSFL